MNKPTPQTFEETMAQLRKIHNAECRDGFCQIFGLYDQDLRELLTEWAEEFERRAEGEK